MISKIIVPILAILVFVLLLIMKKRGRRGIDLHLLREEDLLDRLVEAPAAEYTFEESKTTGSGKIGLLFDEKMKRTKSYKVTAEIAHSHAPLKFTSQGEVQQIDISDFMKCSLTGECFLIQPLHTEEQIILQDQPTIWRWNVTPLKQGLQELVLVASRKIQAGEQFAFHDEPVYTRYIQVNVDYGIETKNFVVKNWQWIVGTLVGSGVLWQILRKGK
jgi:hypothetical protein